MKRTASTTLKPYNKCLSCPHRSTRCDGPRTSAMELRRWCEFMRDMKELNGLTNLEIAEKCIADSRLDFVISSVHQIKDEKDFLIIDLVAFYGRILFWLMWKHWLMENWEQVLIVIISMVKNLENTVKKNYGYDPEDVKGLYLRRTR